MLALLATGVVLMMNFSADQWRSIDDSVMGGISAGRVTATDQGIRFEGDLSLENNGGFSSVRYPVTQDLSNVTGVRLTFKGDGRRYQFRLRQDRRFDGVAWRQEFETSIEWQTLELNFDDFDPVFRGRIVASAGKVRPEAIEQIGFLLADKNPGKFYLDIREIEFITTGER